MDGGDYVELSALLKLDDNVLTLSLGYRLRALNGMSRISLKNMESVQA